MIADPCGPSGLKRLGGLATAGVVIVGLALAARTANTSASPTAPLQVVRQPRVVVVKAQRRLYLFDGDLLVRCYPVALGGAPLGQKQRIDDERTPEGLFRICVRNADSPNHRFLGLNYPDATSARRGLHEGVISKGEYRDLAEADRDGRCPNWATPLGGGIGLHGGGVASDWTAGCIALGKEDIDELFGVLRTGDAVEILP